MKEFTIEQAVTACRGTYTGDTAFLHRNIRGVEIDNRRVGQDFLFVPIKGERLDGHQFIDAAFSAGALCCLSDHPLNTSHPYILVEDTLLAFQNLAEFYRGLFDIKVVAITGSSGKTTTKEMVAGVLSESFSVLKTQGNLNNQTGVPLTVFGLEDGHDVAVIEMGTNHFGEIRSVAKIVRPDYCFLTNIGDAHIEHLGSKEGIRRAKCEMLEFMKPGGTLFFCGDDPLLAPLANEYPNTVSYGLLESNDVHANNIVEKGFQGTAFDACEQGVCHSFFVPAPGEYMVLNSLAAIACGHAFLMDDAAIAKGILSYTPAGRRMSIRQQGSITILDDVYNANPHAMKTALTVLAQAEGRKVAILGDMLELGEESPRYHREVGAFAAQAGVDLLLAVGTHAKEMLHGATLPPSAHFETQDALISSLQELILPGDTVLVKASRGMGLERTVEALLEQFSK